MDKWAHSRGARSKSAQTARSYREVASSDEQSPMVSMVSDTWRAPFPWRRLPRDSPPGFAMTPYIYIYIYTYLPNLT